jgi:ribosome-associated heat shock protein Hsp15
MRIDKLLWYLRFAGSRSFAQQWVLAGHIRLNGVRVVKPSTSIAVGDVVTLPMRTQVRVVEILALPARRGPAPEARSCYLELDAAADLPLAARE